MNNYNIKTLRQAMLSTAVAALVSIGFMACSSETEIVQNPTAPAGGYQVCIPASFGGGSTRALAYNSESGGYDATFETTDVIGACHVNSGRYISRCLNPDRDGKSAYLVGNIDFGDIALSVGDELLLFYKSDQSWLNYSHNFVYDQSEVEYALAKVTIESIEDGKMTLSAATFLNPQSIYKINFTGINSDVKIKKMTIISEKEKLVNWFEPTNFESQESFGNVIYTYQDEGTSQHELTYMLRFGTNPYRESDGPGDVITFNALGSDGHTYIGIKSVTNDLENSKYYYADVAMTDLGLALTLTNNTTGDPVELEEWTTIRSDEAQYTLMNNGYGISLGWCGGNNTLTLNAITITNTNRTFLHVQTDYDDPDNTKEHYLVLDGESTINMQVNGPAGIYVNDNCTLHISAASTGGKLIFNSQGANIATGNNSNVTLESGELTLNGFFGYGNNTSFVITNTGKVRSANPISFIKAGSGYKLVTSVEDGYTVYTVTAADPYEEPKALSTATTADIGKIIGSDGNIHVPNWDLPNGVSPVAVITRISSTGHGLAVAIDKIKLVRDEWSFAERFSWDNTGNDNNGKTATEIFDDWKANNNVTFGIWRFATVAEWQQMVLDCGIAGDATVAGDDMVAEGLAQVLKDAGINVEDLSTWTGEQGYQDDLMTMIRFDNNYWDEINNNNYKGPFKLVYRGNGFASCENILPTLEF